VLQESAQSYSTTRTFRFDERLQDPDLDAQVGEEYKEKPAGTKLLGGVSYRHERVVTNS